jgi:hypothetical protein
MTESHQHLLSIFHILHELRDVLHVSDLFKHPQDCLIGSSMSWTVESSDSSSE